MLLQLVSRLHPLPAGGGTRVSVQAQGSLPSVSHLHMCIWGWVGRGPKSPTVAAILAVVAVIEVAAVGVAVLVGRHVVNVGR